MLQRHRIALCEAEGSATTPAAAAQPAATQPASSLAPELPADLKELVNSPEAFKARLSKEREVGTKSMLKDLGFANVDEARTFLAQAKKDADAKKTEAEKMAERFAALEPKAKQAEQYERDIREYLEIEEKQIPEDKRSLLDLAPSADSPSARMKWIAAARARGLFAAATAPSQQAPKPVTPANTIAPPGPTPPAPTGGASPQQIYDAHIAAGRTMAAANFAQMHPLTAIDRRPPNLRR